MPTNNPTNLDPNKFSELSGIFTAIVESSDSSTYNVVVSPVSTTNTSIQRLQGIPLSHCLSNFFGFKEHTLPQPGSTVLCIKVQPHLCYILGTISKADTFAEGDTVVYPSRANLGQGDSIVDQANLINYGKDLAKIIINNIRRNTDVVSGEHVIGNDFGVLIGLFQQLAVLKASELAQIQCFLMDDMVRIISHNFQHYSALGEYKIYHDGRALLSEFSATHIPNETYGVPIREADNNNSTFVKDAPNVANDSTDFYKLTNEQVQAIERFKVYIGRIGDFINAFMSIPAEGTIHTLDGTQPTTPDLGAFNFHLGADGSLHIRTIKDVFIEKVNWIRVPRRVFEPDNPLGDDSSTINYQEKAEFIWNNDYKYEENPFLYYLQLKDYIAYVTQVCNYQNLQQHPKDFYVNNDINKESPISGIGHVDPQTPESNQGNFVLRNSTMGLMENGGFILKDAWGSAIIAEGGNIYIQPAKDLIFQPMRNLIAKVGQFVSIAAQNDIDFSSTAGGLRYKSDLAQYFYSDNSGVVFQANGDQPSQGTPEAPNAVEQVGGIVFKSKLGIYNYATTDILQYASNSLIFKSDNNIFVQGSTVIVQSPSTIELIADDFLGLYSKGSAELLSTQAVLVGGASDTAIGQKDTYIAVEYQPNNPFVDPIMGSFDVSSSLSEATQSFDGQNFLQYVDSFQNKEAFQKLNFRFLSTDSYGSLSATTDPIPQTVAQQIDQFISSGNFTPWQENEVNGTYPYPGADLITNIFASTSGFNNVQFYPGGVDTAETADGTNQATQITINSLLTYPVLTLQ